MTQADETPGVFDAIPPHRIQDGFLGAEWVERLLQHACLNQERFQDSTTGTTANERVNPEWRVSRILRDFGPYKKALKAHFNAILPEALNELGMPAFDLFHTELELVAHANGAFYKTHIDTAIDRDDESVRVLTGVYYFHAMPKAFQGGNIRLLPLRQSRDAERFLDVEPINDRLLLFPSWVPHCVMPVVSASSAFSDSRFAINCWYRKRKHTDKA